MNYQPSVLCPIDFSDSSRGALRYAAAIAAHFGARLTPSSSTIPCCRRLMRSPEWRTWPTTRCATWSGSSTRHSGSCPTVWRKCVSK